MKETIVYLLVGDELEKKELLAECLKDGDRVGSFVIRPSLCPTRGQLWNVDKVFVRPA